MTAGKATLSLRLTAKPPQAVGVLLRPNARLRLSAPNLPRVLSRLRARNLPSAPNLPIAPNRLNEPSQRSELPPLGALRQLDPLAIRQCTADSGGAAAPRQ